MLNENLYSITSWQAAAGKVLATITIDASHKIFEGHFPGQPVLPGVCMMQIVKELTEKATDKKLFLHKASQCKFLSMVDPTKTREVKVVIDLAEIEGYFNVNAVLKTNDAVFLKMNCSFKII